MQTISDTMLPNIDDATSGETAAGGVAQAMAMIDGSLVTFVKRELVSTSEVVDLLLDVRTLLAESLSSAN